MLEKLKGNCRPSANHQVFPRADIKIVNQDIISGLIPFTPHLQRLRVFEGDILKGTGSLICQHCPHFSKIGFFGWLVILNCPQKHQTDSSHTGKITGPTVIVQDCSTKFVHKLSARSASLGHLRSEQKVFRRSIVITTLLPSLSYIVLTLMQCSISQSSSVA